LHQPIIRHQDRPPQRRWRTGEGAVGKLRTRCGAVSNHQEVFDFGGHGGFPVDMDMLLIKPARGLFQPEIGVRRGLAGSGMPER